MGMPNGMPVSVAPALSKTLTRWSEFSGRLRAVEDVAIRPRVSGTIDMVSFKEGDFVQAGSKLFTIDLRPYQASYEQAKARAELADLERQRADKLFSDKVIAKRELDEKSAAAKEAKASLDLAALNLEYAEVKAPISGVVGKIEISVGNFVSAAAAPVLTTMQSIDPIYADFEIDEQTYLQIMKPLRETNADIRTIPVSLALANESEFSRNGEISSFDNQLNPTSGTLRVRATFANADKNLTPGLFARIRMGSATPVDMVLVHEQAIGTDQNKKFVYVIKDDGTSEYREVKLGVREGKLREITEGLKAGELIVVNGLQRVPFGMKLLPQTVDMETLAGQQPATPPEAGAEAPKEKEAE